MELHPMGCELGQGYCFSEPLDTAGMTGLMQRASYGYGRLGAVSGQDLHISR